MTDSEITRLVAELLEGRRSRYKILSEVAWILDNSTELTEEDIGFYRSVFKRLPKLPRHSCYTETLH